jgi:hypothetical protein
MFNQDFKEFLQLLNEHDVRYLIIGGYAGAIRIWLIWKILNKY